MTRDRKSQPRTKRDPRHDILFEPIQIGPKLLKNRFYQVPQCGPGGSTTPMTQAAHRAVKAEGGWAVLCTEETNVSLDSDQAPLYMGTIWDDDDMRRYALMTNAVHEHGALAGVELSHGGLRTWNRSSRWPNIGPSATAVAGPIHDSSSNIVAKAMELDDIERIKDDYRRATRRAMEAGFDIVYVYGSAGFLPAQFLSPFTNRRTDKYGGSFENRARFFVELLETVRKEVEGKCVLAARISVGRSVEPPFPIEMGDNAEFIKLADDLVDLWDINDADLEWSFRLGGIDSAPSRFHKEGYLAEAIKPIRDLTQKPIVGVGRLTSPDRMAEIIRSGVYDLIGAARPSISDPYLPKKIEEGRYEDVRECTGSNLCIYSVRHHGNSSCIQNATAFEEYRRGWHPEHFSVAANADKDVLVVGAGPAGMECAMVLGLRKMRRIHLVDAAPEIGGHLRWATTLPGMGEWGRIINWRQIQLGKLKNVEIVNNVKLSADEILDYGAEIVVLAIGAHWSTIGFEPETNEVIPGADAALPHVITPEQFVLDGKRPSGKSAVIYDDEGYYNGVGIAQILRSEGYDVTIVSPSSEIASMMSHTKEKFLVHLQLRDQSIKMRRSRKLLSVSPNGYEFENVDGEKEVFRAAGLILITQRVADDNLYHQIMAKKAMWEEFGVEAVYRIGDCLSPRLAMEAIFDGHRLGREIDTENPAVPLPHKRELMLAP